DLSVKIFRRSGATSSDTSRLSAATVDSSSSSSSISLFPFTNGSIVGPPYASWFVASQPVVRTGLTGATRLVFAGCLGATKQLTHPPPLTASKPVKACVQPVGPHFIWLKRNRLEYFDEARIRPPRNKPSAYCVAEVSPRVRGGLHVDRENVKVAESV